MMRLLITGSGTEVGKTYVTVALLQALRRAGRAALGLKPIETGYLGPDSDAAAVALDGPVVEPRYSFAPPISPHLAAREAHSSIDVQAIAEWVHENSGATLQYSVIETAGGLFTPLSESTSNADLVTALAPCAWLLVTPNRLGALHDVAVHLRAAAALGSPLAVVLTAKDPDHATESNVRELRRLHPRQHFVTLGHDLPEDADQLIAALEAARVSTPPT